MADWGAIIGLVSQVAGSAAGQAASQMDKDAAMRLIQESTDAYGKIQIPKLQQLMLQQQGKTNLAGIQDDPKYRDQENAADAEMGDLIKSGGLTLADKAALNAIRNKTARTESAGRNAILGGMAARGTLDSGSQLAAQLQGNQQSANTLADEDASAAGQAQARGYQAIKDRAAMASKGLDRTYQQKSDAARAQDAINAGNTAIMNTAARFNAAIPQQDFNNELELTNAQTNAKKGLAAVTAGRAKDTQQQAEGMGNMIGSAAKNAGGKSNGAPMDYSDGAAKNTEGLGFDQGTTDTNNDTGGFESYPGSSSDGLHGESTRGGQVVIGHDENGNPIYGNKLGSNF